MKHYEKIPVQNYRIFIESDGSNVKLITNDLPVKLTNTSISVKGEYLVGSVRMFVHSSADVDSTAAYGTLSATKDSTTIKLPPVNSYDYAHIILEAMPCFN